MTENLRKSLLPDEDISEIQKLLQEIDNIEVVTKTKVEDIIVNSNKDATLEWNMKQYTINSWDDFMVSYTIDNKKREANINSLEIINDELISLDSNDNIEIKFTLWKNFLKEIILNIKDLGCNIINIDSITKENISSGLFLSLESYEKILWEFLDEEIISRFERKLSKWEWLKSDNFKIKIIIK